MPQGRGSGRVYLIVGAIIVLLAASTQLHWGMPRVQLPAESIFRVAGFSVTNTLLATWLAMLVLIVFFSRAMSHAKLVPGRVQNLAEMIIEMMMGLCVSVAGEKRGRQYFTLVTSIFLFALVGNWMGLLPGFNTIGLWREIEGTREFIPLLRGSTTDLNTTVALALISVGAIQFYGARALGFFAYLGKFVNFHEGPIGFAVGLLELVSEVARIISFSFRLFGNIFAGEVLLTVMSFLVPLIVSIPFLGLEVFVGFIQALIFAMLTLVFLTIATTGHGGQEGSAEHDH